MSQQIQGVIDSIYTKNVNTRYGARDVYHAMINGQDINLGFNCAHTEDEYVTLEVESTQYGLQVIDPNKTPAGGNSSGASPASVATAVVTKKTEFPIDKDSKGMSITRQNSSGHAARIVAALVQQGELKTEAQAMEAFFRIVYEITDFSTGHRELKAAEDQGK